MTSRWLVVLVVASLALNVAVVAGFFVARGRGPGCPPPMFGMKPGDVREIAAMRERFDPKMDTLRQQLNAARGGLYRLAADSASPVEAESLLQVIGDIRIEMNRLAYQHMRQVMAKLSPEHRAEFLRRLEQGPGSWHDGPDYRKRGHRRPRRIGRDCPPPAPDLDDR
ncbi:MAG: hypothetical protein R6X13_07675 [bacterium]